MSSRKRKHKKNSRRKSRKRKRSSRRKNRKRSRKRKNRKHRRSRARFPKVKTPSVKSGILLTLSSKYSKYK